MSNVNYLAPQMKDNCSNVGHARQENTLSRFRPPGLPLKFSRYPAAQFNRPDTYGRGLTSAAQLLMFFGDCTGEITASVAEFSCLALFNTSLLAGAPKHSGVVS